MNREQKLKEFINKTSWSDATSEHLKQDASMRRYFRLIKNSETRLLMDAPPDSENISAYLKVTEYLRSYGLRVPEIYTKDEQTGFALIEDFGTKTFTRLLNDDDNIERLYMLAVDVLVQLHERADVRAIDLQTYTLDTVLMELGRFLDWFVPMATGSHAGQSERKLFEQAWGDAISAIIAQPDTLMMRDYHVDNLMIVDGKYNVEHCGLLDYQDAMRGPAAYDLMSLIKDERYDVPADVQEKAITRYIDGRSVAIGRDDLMRQILILGAQRHCKNLGIFARLVKRDNKDWYMKYVPHVQSMLRRELAHPLLVDVRERVYALVPDLEISTV